MISFDELRRINLQRCRRWHPGGLNDWSLSDWYTATVGELGKAGNVIKKLNRSRDGIVGNNIGDLGLKNALRDELADTIIYLDLLAAAAGIDLANAVVSKFNEVSLRNGFPERLQPTAAAELVQAALKVLKSLEGVEDGSLAPDLLKLRRAAREFEACTGGRS